MDILLIVIGVLVVFLFIGAGVAFVAGSGQRTVDERLEQFVGGATPVEIEEAVEVAGNRTDMADRLDKAIAGRGFSGRIRQRIAEADLKLRVTEYIGLQLSVPLSVWVWLSSSFGAVSSLWPWEPSLACGFPGYMPRTPPPHAYASLTTSSATP